MAKSKADMAQMLGLLIIVVMALALTPTIATSAEYASYTPLTVYVTMLGSSSNSTTLAHTAKNSTATDIIVVLDQTDKNGHTTETWGSDYWMTAATTLTWNAVLNKSITYNASVTYLWQSLGAAGIALLNIVPLLWVTFIIAAVVVFVVYKLRMH